jgi:hypothetical protein
MKKNTKVTIIAGPCSVDKNNINQIKDIIKMGFNKDGKFLSFVWGVRVVGIKSRTSLNSSGEGMGIDFNSFYSKTEDNVYSLKLDTPNTYPSLDLVKDLIRDTKVVIATEIMDPLLQLPVFEKNVPNGRLFIWNPAVNQLGYQMLIMGLYAKKNNWYIGIKNGKWLGVRDDSGINIMEKNWSGQVSFATNDFVNSKSKIAMINRGVDIENRGDYRNFPSHESAKIVKKMTGTKMFFDPSHSLGSKLRDKIVEYTINSMKMTNDDGSFVYDGILVEVGDSVTDTKQHITIDELRHLCLEISKFRDINQPGDDL